MRSIALAAAAEPQRIVRMSATRRLVHWVNALSVAVCAITGLYIANPFYVASIPYLTAWNRAIHLYGAVVLDISLLIIMYLYFFSTVERPVAPLIPSRNNLIRFQEAFLNLITFNRRKRFDSSQPDPLNGVLFLILHGLIVVQLFTGLQLYVFGLESGYSVVGTWWPSLMHLTTDWTSAVFGGIGGVRLAHHTMMYPIIAWALLHIYYEIWRTIAWKEGDINIAFGGYKVVQPK
jgi:Ni/Fe-hydrogenase 1 B-type cytochrome subunit